MFFSDFSLNELDIHDFKEHFVSITELRYGIIYWYCMHLNSEMHISRKQQPINIKKDVSNLFLVEQFTAVCYRYIYKKKIKYKFCHIGKPPSSKMCCSIH